MAFNLRRLLTNRKDKELVAVRAESKILVDRAQRGYTEEGSISGDLARKAYEAVETLTVSTTLIKKRIETGERGSHLALRDSGVNWSPKRADREWGRSLRERRGV